MPTIAIKFWKSLEAARRKQCQVDTIQVDHRLDSTTVRLLAERHGRAIGCGVWSAGQDGALHGIGPEDEAPPTEAPLSLALPMAQPPAKPLGDTRPSVRLALAPDGGLLMDAATGDQPHWLALPRVNALGVVMEVLQAKAQSGPTGGFGTMADPTEAQLRHRQHLTRRAGCPWCDSDGATKRLLAEAVLAPANGPRRTTKTLGDLGL